MGRPANRLKQRLAAGIEPLGGRVLNYTTPGQIGSPDCIVMLPGAYTCFVEIKTTDTLKSHQAREHDRLRALGYPVFVARGVNELNHVIKGIHALWTMANC